MSGLRAVKIPAKYYEQLRAVQTQANKESMTRVPLWKCFSILEQEKQKWIDARRRW